MKTRNVSSIIVRILISAALIFLLFYSMLPAINPRIRISLSSLSSAF